MSGTTQQTALEQAMQANLGSNAQKTDESTLSHSCYVKQTEFSCSFGDKSDSSDDHPVEAGRYWIFQATLCPFAHRTAIVRELFGLRDAVGMTSGNTPQSAEGWDVRSESRSSYSEPNPTTAQRLPELYRRTNPDFSGRASVPVLFDLRTDRIVCTESALIVRALNGAFRRSFATCNKDLDLWAPQPEPVDEFNKRLETDFISPLYGAGFSKDDEKLKQNSDKVFAWLDWFENQLSDGREFALGNQQLTAADVFAYVHLVRFAPVYVSLYRLDAKRFDVEYTRITSYLQRLAAKYEAFRDTTDVPQIVRGYFESWNQPTAGKTPSIDYEAALKLRTAEKK